MRISHKLAILAVMVTALLMGHARAASAQDKGASATSAKIAVLDDQKLLSESLAAKSIDSQLKTRRESIEKQLSALEHKLSDTKDKIDSDKDKVKPDAWSKEVASYQNDYLNAHKFADGKRQELEQAANGALGKMRMAITKIVTGLAQKNGYTLVLTRQDVVLATDDMDITDQVLAELDKTLPSVKVDFDDSSKKADDSSKKSSDKK